MSNLKSQLIRLGTANPELRSSLKPVLAHLSGKVSSKEEYVLTIMEDLSGGGLTLNLLLKHHLPKNSHGFVDLDLVSARGRELSRLTMQFQNRLKKLSNGYREPETARYLSAGADSEGLFVQASFAFAKVGSDMTVEDVSGLAKAMLGRSLRVRVI